MIMKRSLIFIEQQTVEYFVLILVVIAAFAKVLSFLFCIIFFIVNLIEKKKVFIFCIHLKESE